ncbi:MAG: hypothetical protein OXB84_05425 [Halobacteriovoraceae bacterium]|nr:hypothetical protein [Halobacteriovoraceae bacterium]
MLVFDLKIHAARLQNKQEAHLFICQGGRKMNVLSLFKKSVGLAMCLHLISCSQNPNGGGLSFMKDMTIETYENDHGETRLEGFFHFNLSEGTRLPTINLPIYDDLFNEIGTMSLLGYGAVVINMNISNAKSFGSGDGLLPNGTRIPLQGVKRDQVIELLLDGGNSVYLAAGTGVSMIGAAITIAEMDRSTGLDVYFPFNFNGFQGEVGFFSNIRENGQTGLSFFIDISNHVPPSDLLAIVDPQNGNKGQRDPNTNRSVIEVEGQNTDKKDEIWRVFSTLEDAEELTVVE